MRERPPAAGAAVTSRRSADGAAPLRALRASPSLPDDAVVAHRLRGGALSAEDARWARAWLVCSQAHLMADPRYGDTPTPELPFEAMAVPAPKGVSDGTRRQGVLDALLGAGVLRPALGPGSAAERGTTMPFARRPRGLAAVGTVPAPPASPAPGWVTWAPEVCVAHAVAVALDWPHLVAACAREPAALLVARTLAEFLVPLNAWAMVPRRDLVDRTGYQQKQVRVALRRLAASKLVEIDGESGRVGRYRFTSEALGPRWDTVPIPQTLPLATQATAAADPGPERARPSAADEIARAHGVDGPMSRRVAATDEARATSSHADGGLDVVVGGVTVRIAPGAALDIESGLRARIAAGPDGRPQLTIGP